MWRLLPREVESLWTLFTAPVVWALHFLACYVGAAVFCEKPDLLGGSFDTSALAIALRHGPVARHDRRRGRARLAAMGLWHGRSAA